MSALERMADELGKRTSDLSADLPKGDAGVNSGVQGLPLEFNANKTPTDPVLFAKKHGAPLSRRHANELSSDQNMVNRPASQTSSDNFPRLPPTPPIAAITPVKFPRGPIESCCLSTSFGKQESGLDALERWLVAEVDTRQLDTDSRPDVRSVVRPITIPPRDPSDGVNDSAISSLTLADRDAIVKGMGREAEQEHDRDSDERTQHVENGQIPSDDERDVRTQMGKSVRRGGKSKHSDEDHERVGRRRERKNVDLRKLRKEAQGRIAAWLGGIDATAPPATDDSTPVPFPSEAQGHVAAWLGELDITRSFAVDSFPSTPNIAPLSESSSFRPPALHDDRADEHRNASSAAAQDGLAAPNPRSSGFVTISTLGATRDSRSLLPKQSPRRSSVNDLPKSSPHFQTDAPLVSNTHLPSPDSHFSLQDCSQVSLINQSAIHLPRLSPDPEEKINVRSARGGRGGKVARVASLWAAKATESSIKKSIELPPAKKSPPNMLKQPARKVSTPTAPINGSSDTKHRHGQHANPAKATTVPAVISSSHAVPMLSSTASLARSHIADTPKVANLTPMMSETASDIQTVCKSHPKPGRHLGDLAFGKAKLKALIQKYQG